MSCICKALSGCFQWCCGEKGEVHPLPRKPDIDDTTPSPTGAPKEDRVEARVETAASRRLGDSDTKPSLHTGPSLLTLDGTTAMDEARPPLHGRTTAVHDADAAAGALSRALHVYAPGGTGPDDDNARLDPRVGLILSAMASRHPEGTPPVVARRLRENIQTTFGDCLESNALFVESILTGEAGLESFESYGHQLHQSVTKLRNFIFHDQDEVVESLKDLGDVDFSELSSRVGPERKEALIHCLLQTVIHQIDRAQEARWRAIFADPSLSKEEKFHALAKTMFLSVAARKWVEIEFVFGGKLSFHNLYHMMKMSSHAAKLMEGVEFEPANPRYLSLQDVNFLAAVFHDGKMVYQEGADLYKRRAGLSVDCSEGASAADLMRQLEQEHEKLRTRFEAPLAELREEGETAEGCFLFRPEQLDFMQKAIEATVPRVLDFMGPRTNRLHTVGNGGELYTPDYTTADFKDPAMEDRHPATHEFSCGWEEGMNRRLAFYERNFLANAGSFERAIEKLGYLAVPLSDLSSAATKESREDSSFLTVIRSPFRPLARRILGRDLPGVVSSGAASSHVRSMAEATSTLLRERRGLHFITSWVFGESVGLWAEENPVKALAILLETKRRSSSVVGEETPTFIEAAVPAAGGAGSSRSRTGEELIEAVKAKDTTLSSSEKYLGEFLIFMQGQENFGLGRLTAMQERVYLPLLVMEKKLQEMVMAGERNPALLPDAWSIDRISKCLEGISAMKTRFETLYCNEDVSWTRADGVVVKEMHRGTLDILKRQITRLMSMPIENIYREFGTILWLRNGRPDMAVGPEFGAFSRLSADLDSPPLTRRGVREAWGEVEE